VHEQLAGLCLRDQVRRDARVRAADPETVGLVLARLPAKEVRVGRLLASMISDLSIGAVGFGW
jgi:hypothetical protein